MPVGAELLRAVLRLNLQARVQDGFGELRERELRLPPRQPRPHATEAPPRATQGAHSQLQVFQLGSGRAAGTPAPWGARAGSTPGSTCGSFLCGELCFSSVSQQVKHACGPLASLSQVPGVPAGGTWLELDGRTTEVTGRCRLQPAGCDP